MLRTAMTILWASLSSLSRSMSKYLAESVSRCVVSSRLSSLLLLTGLLFAVVILRENKYISVLLCTPNSTPFLIKTKIQDKCIKQKNPWCIFKEKASCCVFTYSPWPETTVQNQSGWLRWRRNAKSNWSGCSAWSCRREGGREKGGERNKHYSSSQNDMQRQWRRAQVKQISSLIVGAYCHVNLLEGLREHKENNARTNKQKWKVYHAMALTKLMTLDTSVKWTRLSSIRPKSTW